MRLIRQTLRFTAVLLAAYLAPGQINLSGAQSLAQGVSQSAPQSNMGGKTLMTFCGGKSDVDSGVCSGYIIAIAEAMSAGQIVYGQKACGLEGIKAQQLSDLVRMDINEHADIQTMKAGPMVAAVMAKSFPCYNDYAPAAGEISGGDKLISMEPLAPYKKAEKSTLGLTGSDYSNSYAVQQ